MRIATTTKISARDHRESQTGILLRREPARTRSIPNNHDPTANVGAVIRTRSPAASQATRLRPGARRSRTP
jgi:hypothetical protein